MTDQMTFEQANEILAREPYATILRRYQEAKERGERPVVFYPMRGGKTLFLRALAARRAFMDPFGAAVSDLAALHEFIPPRLAKRRQIRAVARARKRRRGWR